MTKTSMITVVTGPAATHGRVVLYDRDPRHPDGEIFIKYGQPALTVAPTVAVMSAINRGILTEVDSGMTANRGHTEADKQHATEADTASATNDADSRQTATAEGPQKPLESAESAVTDVTAPLTPNKPERSAESVLSEDGDIEVDWLVVFDARPLTTVSGIGAATAKKLQEANLWDTADLASLSDDDIKEVSEETGIAPDRLAAFVKSARE